VTVRHLTVTVMTVVCKCDFDSDSVAKCERECAECAVCVECESVKRVPDLRLRGSGVKEETK
jgi:hypothetical protein